VQLVQLFDTLVLRYCDERNAALILGPQKGKIWAQFKSALLGGYHYELQIDSAKYLDVEANRRQWLQLYSQVRPDPNVNAVPVLEKLFASFGLDPAQTVVKQLPDKKPDPPKVSVAISADQLNPALPQFSILINLLRQGGFEISDGDVQAAQRQAGTLALMGRSPTTAESPNDPIEAATAGGLMPVANVAPKGGSPNPQQHPGAMSQAPSLSKHLMDESGQMSGPRVQ